MQDQCHEISVESDVNEFMNQELISFDSDLSTAFKDLNVESALKQSKITKRCGLSTSRIVYDLVTISFLMFQNVHLFLISQFEQAVASKSVFYRFIENANYNWSHFIFLLSVRLYKKVKDELKQTLYFVLDDTTEAVTGKLVEGCSYVFDHKLGKTVIGHQKLVLGMFNGARFVPIIQKYCSGDKKPIAKSKATKYKKVDKSKLLSQDSPGAKEREDLPVSKLKKAIKMLKRSQKYFANVHSVLFDSWFSFNSFIITLKTELKLDVICQLKNLPRPNQYIFQGKSYSLAQLYAYYAKPKMRTVKKYNRKQAVLTITLAKSDVQMKIVFLQNEGSSKWHAFGSTNVKMSAKSILESYSQRWSIEVFFKNCKQYLNYGKEQASILDSKITSDAIVFLRYMLLTYLSYKDHIDFYATLKRNRKQRKFIAYGLRLLNYFLKRLSFVINKIIELIEYGQIETAKMVLRDVIQKSAKFDEDVGLI